MEIRYSNKKGISPRSIQGLFRRLEFSDWWTLKDIGWYLKCALYVVSAWEGRKLIGLGILTGDGRIDVHLSILVVDATHQRKGIGTAIVSRLVDRVGQLKPYSFQTDVFDEGAERLYARFGFRKNEGTWLLDHEPTYHRWEPQAKASREARRKRQNSRQEKRI